MSRIDQHLNFMDRCASGAAMIHEIDDYVDRWHDGASNLGQPQTSLADYLGMTADEYQAWVRDASVLPEVLRARRERLALKVASHR